MITHPPRIVLLLLLTALVLAGCNPPARLASQTSSHTPSPPIPGMAGTCTPPACKPGEVYAFGDCGSCCTYCATPTFFPICTPPLCLDDEVYVYGDCPGACCTSCGTPTPQGQQPLVGLCPILATRTPPPSAPTRVADTPVTDRVDPHVEICVSRVSAIRPGEYLEVNAFAVDIGLAHYTLLIQDDASNEINAEVRLEGNEFRILANNSAILQVQEVRGDYDGMRVYLRARAPGTSRVWVTATGEIHYGYPGPAMWAGGGSETILITVGE